MSIEQVEVTPRSLTMRVGEQRYDLRATVYPGNTTCKNVRWESSAPSVVSVNESSGYLHALSGGDAVITAIVDDGSGVQHYGYCDIYVDDSYNDEDPNLRYNVPGNCSGECSSPDSDYGGGGSTSNECPAPAPDYGGGSGGSTECPPPYYDDYGGSESCGYWCPREENYTFNNEAPKAKENTHADPVDVYSGAHLLDLSVLKLFEGRKLELKAHYRSDCLVKGKMGIGWYHDFEKHLKHDKCNIKVYSTPSSYTNYDSSDCIRYTSSRPEKLGFVLTYTQGAQYPYCLDCNSKRKEYYDASGRLAQIVDHQGYVTKISYRSNAIVVTDASVNKSITLEINTAGRIARVYDSAGRVATLQYNNSGHMIRFSDTEGHPLSYTYDAAGRVLSGTDSMGTVFFRNVYDSMGRVEKQYDAFNSTPTVFMHCDCCQYIVLDRNGKKLIREYDENGMLVRYVDGNGNEKRYAYDERQNIIMETDALGHSKKTEYNSKNLPTKVTDQNGNVTRFTYDTNGNLVEVQYPEVNGVSTTETFAYDTQNRLTRHVNARGVETVYTYNEKGMLLTQRTGNRNAVQYTYAQGRPVSVTDQNGAITRYEYNNYGQMVKKTDAEGNVTQYEYDKCGQLLKTIDANGQHVEVNYDGNHQKTVVTDANGNQTSYTYNGNMKNTKITLPDGNCICYEYDREDRLIKTIDQAGNVTRNIYDAAGRLIETELPDGGRVCYTYDAAGRVVKERTPTCAVIKRTYDAKGNVLTITDSDGNVTVNTYDAFSRLVCTSNAVSGITRYTYSPVGDLLCETDAMGHKKQYTYDEYGNKLTFTDANGNVTRYVYDANNRLIECIDALGNRTTYTYNLLGQLVATTDAKNHVIRYGYDALGRRTTVTDARGNTFTNVYDAVGNVVAVLDAKGNTVSETVYNSLNLPALVTDAAGHTTTYTYNTLGKVSTVIDAMGNVQEYVYDAIARNTAVKDAMGHTSSVMYDLLGNVVKLEGPLGGNTRYSYDEVGRPIWQSTVSGGELTYTYNDRGLKKEFKNARGQKRRYFYDVLGRVTGYICAEDSVSYTYDANGNVLTVTDKNGTITRTFDALNRVSTYTDTFGKTIRYVYDDVGNLERLFYPDGTSVYYEYDANRNLIRVSDWAGRATTYTYDENNRVIGVTKPDGSVTSTVYDNKQRIVSTCETTPGGVVITGFEYTYDALSRVVEEKNLANSTKMCYTYDRLSRVLTRTVKDLDNTILSSESYSYDAAGNVTADPTASRFVYDRQNRLTSYKYRTVSYDLDGNMLSVLLGNVYTAFIYDSANRLVKAGNSEYTYNAENVRIRNLCGDEDTTYTYDTNCKLSRMLTKTTNGVTTKYVYGLGLIGEEVAGSFKTYHFDFRGSTVAITDIDGNITDTLKYDTYGKQIEHIGNSDVIFAYNGKDGVVTEPNGLIYMRARYYSPEHRRFINADLVAGEISNAITLNRFAYANGNPVSFVDPFGLFSLKGLWNSVTTFVDQKIIKPVVKTFHEVTNKIVDTCYDIKDRTVAAVNTVVSWVDTNIISPAEKAVSAVDDWLNQNVQVPIVESITGITQEQHYERLSYDDNYDIPSTLAEAESDADNWKLHTGDACHQFTASNKDNVKYVSNDGKYEAIYDSQGNLVTDVRDVGTYNFVPDKESMIGHFQKDVLPWIFWGNAADDSTTISERRYAFVIGGIQDKVEDFFLD